MVFMMMENRTYDHFMGSRSLVEGLAGDGLTASMTCPDMNGNPVALRTAPNTPEALCVLDPPHDWDPSRVQWNGGQMDGFVRAFQTTHPGTDGGVVMEYMVRDNLPVFYALADAYTSCDRWFASLLGPTLPNRLYWLAANSGGARSNDDVIAGAYVGVKTIFDALDEKGITWNYFYNDIPVLQFFPNFSSDKRLQSYDNFLTAAKNGKLPSVVFIDPSFVYNDYHPPHYPLVAEQLVAATYTALATGPHWKNTTMVLTFDEHGGFHDHVAPGKVPDQRAAGGFDQLGLRVPALVIGPRVQKGVVCSTPLEHTSAIRHICNTYGLDPLGMRDAAATDLSSCMDPTADAAAPITLPAVEVDESMLAACGGASFDQHVIFDFAASQGMNVDASKKKALDTVYAIGDFLDQHNLGRIRRGR